MFKSQIKDIMMGYRAFSYEFVKTFPVLSKGFEIETEMSIHAVDKGLSVENVVIQYRDRPEGSESKLNTFSDGAKVLKTILDLFRVYKPLAFFSCVAIVLAVIAMIMFLPVFVDYLRTGLVPRIPTLVTSGFIVLAGLQTFFCGVILNNMVKKNKQDFEFQRQQVFYQKKSL